MKIRLNGLGVMLSGMLAIANVIGLIYIGTEAYGVSHYLSAKSSFSVAEAAYVGALWTEVVAKACMGILLNVVVFGWLLLNMQIDDQAHDLFRTRIVAGLDTLKEQGRKEEVSRTQSAADRPSLQPLAPV